MEYERQTPEGRDVLIRIQDYKEVYEPMTEPDLKVQGARCMDCGIPFCHTGCPLNNIIPDFNALVYRGHWQDALRGKYRDRTAELPSSEPVTLRSPPSLQ